MTTSTRVALTAADKIRRVVILLIVLGCVGLLVVAVQHTRNGDDRIVAQSGSVVEQVIPGRDSEVLQQQQIGVDLGPAYTGTLVVNGVEIPDSQLLFRPELNQVFFQPTDDAVITRFEPGTNCVTALAWLVGSQTRADAREVDHWCFEVT